MTVNEHLHHQTALSTLENGINKWLLLGGLAAATVVLAPVVLPYLGIGGGIAAALSEECCTIVGNMTGIAGSVASAIESIPAVGVYLAENMLVPAVTILGGQAAGHLVSDFEKAAGMKGSIGAFVRVSSLALGVTLALPAILPGIGHGVQFLSRMAGADEFGKAVAIFLGNTDQCTSVATTNGIMGGVSTLAAHLPCAIPAVVTSFPLALSRNASLSGPAATSLPPDDPNNFYTDKEKELVKKFNQAAFPEKMRMKIEFEKLGYSPDYHKDGTVHLFKHHHDKGWARQ